MVHTVAHESANRAPTLIRLPGPIVGRLLRLGIPLGPNGLLTVRGRTSGLPRTQPLAIAEIDGRRFVVGMFGNVNWCRNLRANPVADLVVGGETSRVHAVELSNGQATDFFRDLLPAYVGRMPVFWRIAVRSLARIAAPELLSDPVAAALMRPVFELDALGAGEPTSNH